MDWVTALPPERDRRFNACIVLVERYSKSPIILPCHKADTAIGTAIMIWNRIMSNTGLFKNIISDRDPKSTSELWKDLQTSFGTEVSFSTAYQIQPDGLEKRIIQNLEDMIRTFCAHCFEFKESDGFTQHWCTLLTALELSYETSIHSSTGKTPAMLAKGWNPRLPLKLSKRT
ncbi:hypothetical protein O181_035452 [Austropuccinia psidii MF-1]|uniref:Integrase catalytic domain-containing protein n=1 Tax=Austropuccinia psidii MF-1 TaxID=1389203 RepID=A0A9Q3D8N5_9BASI|nr:hypothetical protein [Austropuccinia psidii MF-1]